MRLAGAVLALFAVLAAGCTPGVRRAGVEPRCLDPELVEPAPPADPACDDDLLTGYDGLLIFAPHPDDEALGFAGLASAYLELGKPVRVVVVTDGDAYCGACRLWKNSSFRGPACDAADLSSFAEVRRGESAAAAAVLGLPAPAFLGYPDTGLAAAWKNREDGAPATPLRRSDFAHCTGTCESCGGGYGEGPATALSAETLVETLRGELEAASEGTLVATTHRLDGHGDHAALGRFVRQLNDELPRPRAVAYAVIHASTPKDDPHPDCWYPAPPSPLCRCMNEDCALADPDRVATLAAYRFRPEWPAALPDDADYGAERQLCLPERLYRGDDALKLRAVLSYPSQLGFAARSGSHPDAIAGIMDCSGYLTSFVRRTEAFVLEEASVAEATSAGTTGAQALHERVPTRSSPPTRWGWSGSRSAPSDSCP